MTEPRFPDVSRRGFLKVGGVAAGLALVPGLAACVQSKSASTSASGSLKFWDMPWATEPYNTAPANLVKA